METYFRIENADEDHEALLDPANQRTEPWGGDDEGRCPKCGGSGETEWDCESCRTGGVRDDCPSCHGEVHYVDTCPACRGTGRPQNEPREGVSVFREPDGLYRYMLRRDANLDGSVLVEVEGDRTGDEDFDADQGALLVRPRRIRGVRPIDRERVAELREESP